MKNFKKKLSIIEWVERHSYNWYSYSFHHQTSIAFVDIQRVREFICWKDIMFDQLKSNFTAIIHLIHLHFSMG